MTTKSLITDEMRAWIGKPLKSGITFEVEKSAIRNMAEAMNYLNPLYVDEAYAKSKGHPSVLAPPMFLTVGLNLSSALHALTFEFEVAAMLHGIDDWEFIKDVHAGDSITPNGKLDSLVEKNSPRGRMLLAIIKVIFTNQHSDVVGVYRHTEIYIAKS